MEVASGGAPGPRRNSIAFWLLGLCNNFAYVVMLSAAKDILEKDAKHIEKPCRPEVTTRECHILSTGSVLLADIIPALIIKMSAPMFIHRVPFGIRHTTVVLLQAASFLIVGISDSTGIALFGVILASFGSGLGEISYLALSSNYPSSVVAAWSSGTGGAGLIGASVYALLTDSKLLAVSPKHTMLIMLTLPVLFSFAYWSILQIPRSIHRAKLFQPSTWIIDGGRTTMSSEAGRISGEEGETLLRHTDSAEGELMLRGEEVSGNSNSMSRIQKALPLLRFMIPLISVYLAEYYINQGLLELMEFDCSHGFSMSSESQYRWFQVTYQLGVFVSRSSSNYLTIPTKHLTTLAILQTFNAVFFTFTAIYSIFPHIFLAFLVIFFEGLLGGASYVNTFRAVHREIPVESREFSMGVVSISDTIGIVFAGFLAMPVHNKICSLPLRYNVI
ncbi:Protein CBR-CLN-3.2 [Caenorhabditis briggsae]|uniref:Battenin n=1 Tax=Caenorhabditis briggsae TaxID=6238 RepID=A8XFR9_CAEBR|nr:Protein CBR-CLN-3.2 [Caenorhabditis briggsae]CAP31765.2 Protein CBR-CLN-3.2 [Caenorhabditis briggsae]